MKDIFKSAAKIVFILLAFSYTLAFLVNVFRGDTTIDSKDFFALVLLVFGFYYKLPTQSQPEGSHEIQ